MSLETVIVGFIVIKEITTTAIAVYNGTGVAYECVTQYRQNRLREKICFEQEKAKEREEEWEDLKTGKLMTVTDEKYNSIEEQNSYEINQDWTIV